MIHESEANARPPLAAGGMQPVRVELRRFAQCGLAVLLSGVVSSGFSGGLRSDLTSTSELAFETYHDHSALEFVLDGWVAAGRAERVEFPASTGGLEVGAVEFGPGLALPPAQRRTLFLVGGLDGVSQAGSEAVLAVCDRLQHERLPEDLSIVALPWGATDALHATSRLGAGGPLFGSTSGERGAGVRLADDDRDGCANEDAPDDLDGDGIVVDMLVEDVAGDLTRDESSRLVRPARAGDVVRLLRAPEGHDDDGDGRYNEDGADLLDIDAGFPIGWSASRVPGRAGRELPLSDPSARHLADLVFERRSVGVLVFQGNHGGLARPGGSLGVPWNAAHDAPWFDRIAGWFAADTQRSQERAWTLADAWGHERPGAFIDWCFAVPGVLALEIAPWGPHVALGSAAEGAPGPVPVSERQELWSRWLDDERAGLGFVPWHVVELEGGVRAWVGGWQPRTVLDPPARNLAASLEGLADFSLSLIAGLPVLELAAQVDRRGEELTRVEVMVVNRGELPTGYSTTGRHPERSGGEVILELRLAGGARLLSGERSVRLPALGGGARGQKVEWLLFAPRGTRISVVARSVFCATVEREVRL